MSTAGILHSRSEKAFSKKIKSQGTVACCDSTSVAPIDAVAFSSAHFGVGMGTIHLDKVGCHGNETTLISCLHNSALSCYSGHYEDAGVRCQGKTIVDAVVYLTTFSHNYLFPIT